MMKSNLANFEAGDRVQAVTEEGIVTGSVVSVSAVGYVTVHWDECSACEAHGSRYSPYRAQRLLTRTEVCP